MCGIVGIYSSQAKDRAPEILNKMKDAIRHRGPDDEGSYFDGPVALGHRRLSIIDLSTGKQPISNQNQTLTTVFNGEIYNFQNIREQLKEYVFQTHTDTEVLVHLYDQKKEKMLADLNGMFAFAIWDKNQNELFIARDRLGIKPVYYYFKDGLFLFASEIKALLKHPQVSRDLSFGAISQYFAYDYVPAPLTIYENIFKLPAGHFIRIKNNQMEIKKYWELPVPKGSNLSYADAKQQLKEKLTASIKQMLIADVPLGIFLSGGIDSTLITQLAVQDLGIRPNTFSIGFEDKSFDESIYAKSAAEHFKTQHHHQVFSAKELLNLLPEVISKMDEPFADPSLLPTYLLSQFASKNVKVVLGGDGGDEVFIGYPTYLAHKYAKQFKLGWDLAAPLLSQLIHYLPVSHNNISLDFKIKSFLRGYQDKTSYRHIIWTGGFSPA
jgi:asparagine synthase (glutamine-hydrolysing)